MKKTLVFFLVIIAFFIAYTGKFDSIADRDETPPEQQQKFREISGNISDGDTLFDIFKRCGLDINELFKIRVAASGVHRLRELYPGRPYKIVLDRNEQIDSFVYWINDDCFLNISRIDNEYQAEKVSIEYEKRTLHIGGVIRDNLISSMGDGKENLLLALQLSDIFAWDIDFAADLRNDDSFKIVVEGLFLDGKFRKYGKILSSEFANNGAVYRAYAFEQGGNTDYYDEAGKSLRKAFLKAPLSFRRVSSNFSTGRYHPILKIYRPHHGLDYAAAAGTPVSAAGSGRVVFAGSRGHYGKLVILDHRNGYRTFYGHLARIGRNIKTGAKVEQGKIIGYVGSTGLATGPHLHYEMRINDKAVNPMTIKTPPGVSIPDRMLASFFEVRDRMNSELAVIMPSRRILADAATQANREDG